MRYTYLGDKLTDEALRGMQCDPVKKPNGKCVSAGGKSGMLVVDGAGVRHVVVRYRLRVNQN